MKIIHTSDWHLGCSLYGHKRYEESEAFLAWLSELLEEGNIDVLLVAGDIFAVWYYHKHAEWSDIKKLLPWTLAGLTLGLVVGNYINDSQFKALIGIIVLLCLGILLYTKKKDDKKNSPGGSQGSKFIAKSGKASGFSVKPHKAGGTRGS